MTNAAWAKVTMTTAKTSTGIDGAANSCTRLTATGATSTILQTLVAAASTRTYSCFIKRITGTGTINLAQGATTLDVTALINSTTFTRVSLASSTLNSAFGIQIITSGDVIDVDFNQFEAGGFATSPMDAAGAVRNADVLSYVTAGNQVDAQGSIYCEASISSVAITATELVGDGGGGSPTPILWSTSTVPIATHDGTGTVSGPTVTAITANTIFKGATNWGPPGRQAFAQGSSGVLGAYDGSFSLASISIGRGANNLFYGTIRNVKIWNRIISAGQLQSLTV
jgi:hypothetical protein